MNERGPSCTVFDRTPQSGRRHTRAAELEQPSAHRTAHASFGWVLPMFTLRFRLATYCFRSARPVGIPRLVG